MTTAQAAPTASGRLRRTPTRPGNALERSRNRWFWAFVTPFLAGLVVFVYIPTAWSLYLSFFDARNTVTPTKFVGLGNYAYLLSEQLFLNSMGTFIVFALVIVPLTFACSLGLALLLHKIGHAGVLPVGVLPADGVSYVVASMVWRMSFFNGARFGMFNTVPRARLTQSTGSGGSTLVLGHAGQPAAMTAGGVLHGAVHRRAERDRPESTGRRDRRCARLQRVRSIALRRCGIPRSRWRTAADQRVQAFDGFYNTSTRSAAPPYRVRRWSTSTSRSAKAPRTSASAAPAP